MPNPNGTPNPKWKKGCAPQNPAGRKPGTPNKISGDVWADIIWARDKLGGRAGMLKFIQSSELAQHTFWKEYWKRAPTEVCFQGDVHVVFDWETGPNDKPSKGPL